MISERIDEITRISPEYRNIILPAPKSVKIELTGNCNFSCTFCARSQKLRDVDTIDRSFFERITKEMMQAGGEELGLFYLCDSLKFSYNYADAEQLHDIARVKSKYFLAIQNNIKFAHRIREENGYKCGLYASYIEYDGEQGQRMLKAVDEIKDYVDEVYALPLYSHGGYVTEQEKAAGIKPSGGNRGRLLNLVDPLPCWATLTEGHITFDGKLNACCFGHTEDLIMADLNQVGFMEGWNSIEFQALRAAHLKKDVRGTPCENCFRI